MISPAAYSGCSESSANAERVLVPKKHKNTRADQYTACAYIQVFSGFGVSEEGAGFDRHIGIAEFDAADHGGCQQHDNDSVGQGYTAYIKKGRK